MKEVIIVAGPPASGKSLVVSYFKGFNYRHFSTGGIFKTYKPYKGLVTPDEFLEDKVAAEISEFVLSKEQGIILDGYPRSKSQAEFLIKIIKNNELRVKMIHLNPGRSIILSRMKYYMICPQCDELYNLVNKKPKNTGICDECKTPLSESTEYNLDLLIRQYNNFIIHTVPAIEYLESVLDDEFVVEIK